VKGPSLKEMDRKSWGMLFSEMLSMRKSCGNGGSRGILPTMG